jgi:hypothetical protein
MKRLLFIILLTPFITQCQILDSMHRPFELIDSVLTNGELIVKYPKVRDVFKCGCPNPYPYINPNFIVCRVIHCNCPAIKKDSIKWGIIK